MNNLITIQENDEKNEKLMKIIDDIASLEYNDEKEAKIIERLKKIYTQEFRHSYSMISKKLYEMESDERDIVSEFMRCIVQKLKIYEKSTGFNADNDKSLINGIIKLNDHINLEIIRIQLNDEADNKLIDVKQQAAAMKEESSEISETIYEVSDQVWNLKNQVESSSTQSITILSVFAGIVFVFTGGFSLISTALQNINNASVYKLTFTLSFVGMLIYDLIYLFFFMVSRITQKDITASCYKTSSHICDCGHKACDSCKGILRFIRKFWYAVLPNIVFLAIMFGVVFIWLYRH